MEDMGTVDVDVDALELFGINIAADILSLVDDEDALSAGHGLAGEDGAVKASTDDEEIVV